MTGNTYLNEATWIRAGFLVIAFMVGGIGLWAALANVSGAVIAPGVVAVETKIKTIQHLEGGVVGKIHVTNGQRVKSGDLLLSLDETVLRANLTITEGDLHEFLARRARLEAERDDEEEIVFPENLTDRQNNPRIAKILAGQVTLFEARRINLNGQQGLGRKQIEQYKQEIKGLESQRYAKQRQRELIRKEMESIRPLVKTGLVTQRRMLALEREAARIEGEYGKHVSDIARMQGTIEETALKILQSTKDFRESVITELRQVQPKILELEERVAALSDKLRHSEIRAPSSCQVHNLAIHTVGGVIKPGAPIMQIVPEEDRLIIEARVNPLDIDQIEERQDAVVRFSAFNARTTPELNGRVIKLSADRMADSGDSAPYFAVSIEIPEEELKRLGKNKLITGMPADVFIRTTERSVMNYLLKPLTDQLARAFREG